MALGKSPNKNNLKGIILVTWLAVAYIALVKGAITNCNDANNLGQEIRKFGQLNENLASFLLNNGNSGCVPSVGENEIKQWIRQELYNKFLDLKQWIKREVSNSPAESLQCTNMAKNRRFVCKQPLKTVNNCPLSWINNPYSGQCYYFSKNNERLSFVNAQNFCQGIGGSLASVRSRVENDFIKSKLFDNTWLGLNDAKQEGNFVWPEGDRVTFEDFLTGQPDNAGNNEDCVEFRKLGSSYKWNDDDCSIAKPFICETLQRERKEVCPHGWSKNFGSSDCYYYGNANDAISCEDAKKYCTGFLGGTLSSVLTRQEWNIANDQHNWLGFHNIRRDGSLLWVESDPKTDQKCPPIVKKNVTAVCYSNNEWLGNCKLKCEEDPFCVIAYWKRDKKCFSCELQTDLTIPIVFNLGVKFYCKGCLTTIAGINRGITSGAIRQENVALRKPTESSSSYAAQYKGFAAVDGNEKTRFVSSAANSKINTREWLMVDLGEDYSIHKIRLRGWNAHRSGSLKVLLGRTYSVDRNFASYIEILNVPGDAAAVDRTYNLPVIHSGRYIVVQRQALREYLDLWSLEIWAPVFLQR